MTNQSRILDRDEVLFAFHQACELPTVQEIIEWTERYPEFADDIRVHASIMWDWAAGAAEPALEADALMLERGRSRALNAIYNAQVAPGASPVAGVASFEEMMTAKGMSVPQLAERFDIERGVLADLVSGRMLAPVGTRLVEAFCRVVAISAQQFDAALTAALASPRLGHAKANVQATIVQRPYRDIIETSSMPAERKRYWLNEE
jgi:hypothetical protein